MVTYTRALGLFPSQAHLVAALDKLDALEPVTLACHHGTVKAGQIPAYLRAFREHNVTGLPPADPVHIWSAPPPPAGDSTWADFARAGADKRAGGCARIAP